MWDRLFGFGFLNQVASFSILDILCALFVSFALGFFIFYIYKRTFSGVMYSASFAISLIAMDLITTLVILAVSSNIIASLGMVGALSIVRFRTVVKGPLDLVYLFWSITTGIIVGIGLLPPGIIGSLFIGGILFVFANRTAADTPYVVVVNSDDDAAEAESIRLISERTKKHLVRSKAMSKDSIELTVEVRLQEASGRFVNALGALPGITNAVLVSYNGDYYM